MSPSTAASDSAALRKTLLPLPTTKSFGYTVSEQTATPAFARSTAVGFDGTIKFSELNLSPATNKLSLSLDLKSRQKYSFGFYFPSGGPKATLTDSKGKTTTISMAGGFTVPSGGKYKLTFEASYSLKNVASFDNLTLNAKSVLPTTSGDSRIDALIRGGTDQWWHAYDQTANLSANKVTGSAVALTDSSSLKNLTYSFLSSQPTGQSMSGFQEMSAAQKDAVRKVFDYYSKVLNVSFTEVAGDGTGNINFGTNQQASSAAYANPPNASGVKDKDYLFLANNQPTNSDAGVQEGGYGWMTILHEIGHTLGLKHPGNYNAGGGGTPGPYLSASEDNRQFSIMSYKDNNATRGANATTAMVYDLAALQYLYGANKSGSTAANGAFTFTDGNNYLQTLWSATGTESIDLSQLKNASNVNLNAGAYSDINITGASTSSVYSGRKNVGLAYGSQINAVTLSSTDGVKESVTLNSAFSSGKFDTINSFDALDDKINLKTSLFGSLTSKNIEFGTAATKSTSKIIINRSTGEVFYDADGNGKKSVAKKIAQFNAVVGRGQVSAANFAFVA